MEKIPVIAIFDVGKTNKKLLLFNEKYEVVHEETSTMNEITDEDGFPCEDINALTGWLKDSFQAVLSNERFVVKGVNFSAYGASFVYTDSTGKVLLPLYNYLKPYPLKLQKQFYETYGGESMVAKQTASPVLGNLNSGMQIYRLKYEKPEVFTRVKYALHLPQYLSFVLSGTFNADITSIGCHTNLWHFQKNKYHEWVLREQIAEKFPPLKDISEIAGFAENSIPVGIGLHDSSAALVPYLTAFSEPFILLSTGTWCITLNPFNHSVLTDYELHNDCLCYLSYKGNPVKASRLFAGNEHEQQVKRLASHFLTEVNYYKRVKADKLLMKKFMPAYKSMHTTGETVMIGESGFFKRKLSVYKNYDEAYHQLIADIMEQQVRSTGIALKGTAVKRIFVDGGFSKNSIYMHLLADAFPEIEVFAATVAQASSLGAAMVMHKHWNSQSFPADIIDLKLYRDVIEY